MGPLSLLIIGRCWGNERRLLRRGGVAVSQRGACHAVSWVRVMVYALVLSATALNVLGGMVARQVSVCGRVLVQDCERPKR